MEIFNQRSISVVRKKTGNLSVFNGKVWNGEVLEPFVSKLGYARVEVHLYH